MAPCICATLYTFQLFLSDSSARESTDTAAATAATTIRVNFTGTDLTVQPQLLYAVIPTASSVLIVRLL